MIAQACLQGTGRLSLWARCYCKDLLSNLENVLPSEHLDSRCEGKTIMWYILTNYWVNLSLALRALWQIICDCYICQHTVYFIDMHIFVLACVLLWQGISQFALQCYCYSVFTHVIDPMPVNIIWLVNILGESQQMITWAQQNKACQA